MANKSKFQAIKGTRDLRPPETQLWNHVEQTAHEVFATFGFGEIRLPIFEPTELFARSVGQDTDIVGKEMYTFFDHRVQNLEALRGEVVRWHEDVVGVRDVTIFTAAVRTFLRGVEQALETRQLDRTSSMQANYDALRALLVQTEQNAAGVNATIEDVDAEISLLRPQLLIAVQNFTFGESVSLRPEATASVCRAYIEHGMQQLPQPVKLYYMGPMFRRERPQKGRYRQFYQIGAEVLGGTDAPAIDAELIEMLMTLFDKLGLEGIELNINSIGHHAPNCRPAYVELLRAELTKVKDKLGSDSQRRIDTNPLRVLDSKLEFEQGVIATLSHIADHLCPDCTAHYASVKTQLELRGIIYRENWRLVRGLD